MNLLLAPIFDASLLGLVQEAEVYELFMVFKNALNVEL